MITNTDIEQDAVYYEIETGDYVSLRLVDGGKSLQFRSPDGETLYGEEPPVDIDRGDYIKVYDEAVQAPANYLHRKLEQTFANRERLWDEGRIDTHVSLRYAFQQSTVVPAEPDEKPASEYLRDARVDAASAKERLPDGDDPELRLTEGILNDLEDVLGELATNVEVFEQEDDND